MADKSTSMSFRFRDADRELIEMGRKIFAAGREPASQTQVMRYALQHLVKSFERGEPIHTDIGDIHPPQHSTQQDVT